MSKYRYVGLTPAVLASGRPVAPGEDITLDAEAVKDPHNQWLFDDELLLDLPPKTAATPAASKSKNEEVAS